MSLICAYNFTCNLKTRTITGPPPSQLQRNPDRNGSVWLSMAATRYFMLEMQLKVEFKTKIKIK